MPYGKVWTPSADTAARISVSAPIEINGAKLAAGTYSIWATPDSASWTIVVQQRTPCCFHLACRRAAKCCACTPRPATGDHVETLMFAFPMIDADSARLELRWGTTVVPLSIKARP